MAHRKLTELAQFYSIYNNHTGYLIIQVGWHNLGVRTDHSFEAAIYHAAVGLNRDWLVQVTVTGSQKCWL